MNKDTQLVDAIDAAITSVSKDSKKVADSCTIYTDGGARPNPGYAGFGIHGKDSNDVIYDGWCGLSENATNSRAELAAYIFALKLTLYYRWHKVEILLDSRYVLDGSNKYLVRWKKNNWVKATGDAVINTDLWIIISNLLTDIKAAKIVVRHGWVKAHSGIHGNEMADANAEKGRLSYINGDKACVLAIQDAVELTPAAKKKAIKAAKVQPLCPLISGKRLLFTTNIYLRTFDKMRIYASLTYDNKKNDHRMLGSRSSDNHYAVAVTKEDIPGLEAIMKYQNRITPDDYAQPVICNLGAVTPVNKWKVLNTDPVDYLKHKRYSVMTPEGEPITKYIAPTKLGFIAIDILTLMLQRLDDYRMGNIAKLDINDITDTIYRNVKNKTMLNTDADGKQLKAFKVKIGQRLITLTIGVDIPPRDKLTAIGRVYPDVKVKLITYGASKAAVRYSVIIDTGVDYGIYNTSDGNLTLVTK